MDPKKSFRSLSFIQTYFCYHLQLITCHALRPDATAWTAGPSGWAWTPEYRGPLSPLESSPAAREPQGSSPGQSGGRRCTQKLALTEADSWVHLTAVTLPAPRLPERPLPWPGASHPTGPASQLPSEEPLSSQSVCSTHRTSWGTSAMAPQGPSEEGGMDTRVHQSPWAEALPDESWYFTKRSRVGLCRFGRLEDSRNTFAVSSLHVLKTPTHPLHVLISSFVDNKNIFHMPHLGTLQVEFTLRILQMKNLRLREVRQPTLCHTTPGSAGEPCLASSPGCRRQYHLGC